MKLLSVLAICVAVVVSTSSQHKVLHSSTSRSSSESQENIDRQWLSTRMNTAGGISGEGEYKQGREYTYVYNGQLLSGIPQSSKDYAGTRVQAVVSLVFETAQRVFMQLRHIRFGSFTDKTANPRQVQPFEMFDQVEIDETLKQKLQLSVRFEYINGMIKDIHFDGEEQPWSANIKRSVLNMLQVNLQKERRTEAQHDNLKTSRSREEQRDELALTNDFYTVIEDSIEGECETSYVVESLPTQENSGEQQTQEQLVLNVTKTINFEKCNRRPEIKYNYRFQDWCPTCDGRYNNEERAFLSSTIVKQNLTVNGQRDRVLIESAIVESQYTFMPFNENGNLIQTYVNQTLVLVKVSSSIENAEVARLSSPIKSDSGLIWTPDWDITKERFFMNGDSGFIETSPYAEIRNKVEFVKNLLQKLINYMRTGVDEEAPRQYARLVKVFRMLKSEELEQVHEKFFKGTEVEGFTREEMHKIRSLLPDVIAQAGTKQCVDHIVEKIQIGDIKPWKGALAIRKLFSVRVVSEQMIEKLATLTTEEWCSTKSKAVCESSLLAIGSMLNALCVPNKDLLAIEFKKSTEKMCPRELKQKWVEKLFSEFDRCESEMCRVGLLKTINNAGLDLSVYRLEKIARDEDNKYSQLVRVEAILAYRHLINYMPRKVQKVLMPIYMNKMAPAYVRMAAFNKLMETQPEKFILDQLTRSLFVERNRQVASFAYTTMQTLANSTNPCEKRIAHDLTLSLNHARHLPVSSWWSYSKKMSTGYHSKDKNMGFDFHFNSIYSNYSMLPKDLAASLNVNMGSLFTRNLFTIGVTQSNFDRFVRRALRTQGHHLQSSLSDLLEGKIEESISPKFRKSMEQIYENLNIDERDRSSSSNERDVEDEAFAMIYMRVFGQEYGFLPISQQMIPEQLRRAFEKENFSISKLIKDAERLLKDVEIPFSSQSATFLHEMARKIPTTFGMPLQLTTKSPVVAQATGVFKVNVDSMKKIRVELKDFKPSFTITAVQKLELWSPIVNTAIKVIGQVKVYAPSSVRLVVDAEKTQPEIKLTIEPTEQKEFDLIKVHTRPSMSVLSWPRFLQQWQEPTEKTIFGSDWTRVNEIQNVYGEKSLGVAFDVRGSWHHTPARHVSNTPYCPFSGPNKLTVRVRPGLDMPKEFDLTITGKLFEQMAAQHSVSPKFDKFFEKSDEFDGSNDQSEQKSEERSYEKHYKNYQESGPTQHQLKFVAQTRGSSMKRELIAEVDYQIGSQGKVQKLIVKIDRTPIPQLEQDNWKLIAELETLLPKTPMTVSEMTSDKKFMSRLNIKWGHVSGMDKYIDIKLVADQSRQMRQELEKSLYKKTFEQESLRERHQSLFSPVAQYEQTIEAAYLDQYKFDIDYSVSASFKNVTEKIFRMYKYLNYWQTDVNNKFDWDSKTQDSLKDQLRVRVNIDPINRHYLNVTVHSPKEIVRIEDIPMMTEFKGLNMRRVSSPNRNFYQWLVSTISRDYEQGVCQIRTDRINTFDNVDYRSPITTCYSVLAKDCGSSKQHNKFVVLMKRQSESSELKTVKIITEDTKLIIRARKSSSDKIELECELNGESPVACDQLPTEIRSHNHVVMRVEKYDEEKYVRVNLIEAGIRVFFDGLSANVKVSPVYTRAVCGMCGEYNQEETLRTDCQLRTARKECINVRQPRQLMKLLQSFLIRDSECTNVERYTNEEEHYQYKSLQWEESNEEHYGSLEESRKSVHRSEESTKVRPVERTLTIEQAHEICFSKVPVPKCPKHTMPVEYKKANVKVVYTCMDRSEPQAEEYLRQIRRNERVISEVRELPASFSQQERIPTKCETVEY